jgi:hypothetical protein
LTAFSQELDAAREGLIDVTLVRFWPWLGTACRLAVGAVFDASGASKVGDLAASGRAVAAYRLLPYEMATFVGAVCCFWRSRWGYCR